MNPVTTTGTVTTPGSHAAVTVIGLGLMGSALASAFLAAGHRTTVWNRTPGRADALVGQGAEPAVALGDALTASPIVIACVSTYDVLRELIIPVAGALRGRTLVNLTSGTPEQAREMAAWATEQGIDYLDGAIMAVPQMIARRRRFCSTAARGRRSRLTNRCWSAWERRSISVSMPRSLPCTMWRCWA